MTDYRYIKINIMLRHSDCMKNTLSHEVKKLMASHGSMLLDVECHALHCERMTKLSR